MIRQVIGVAAFILFMSGCGGSSEQAAGEGATPSEKTASPAPTSSTLMTSPSGAPPNVGANALEVGEAREGTGFTTTLLKIRYPYPSGEYRQPERGKAFLGLKVRQCLKEGVPTGDDYSTYPGEWYAASPDGNQATSSSSWNDWPAPKFPESVTMNPGECLRGWLAVEVPQNMKIDKVVYRPAGTTVAEWLR